MDLVDLEMRSVMSMVHMQHLLDVDSPIIEITLVFAPLSLCHTFFRGGFDYVMLHYLHCVPSLCYTLSQGGFDYVMFHCLHLFTV
jgi:putative component of membrane protein insertase Oxa1/YidC/SpoIIIJ protein YidD